jgi:hypothetical protein
MKKFILVLGVLWALPVTIIPFLFYILPLWIFRKYRFDGWDENAFIWIIDAESLGTTWFDTMLKTAWAGWAGSTVGNIIVMKGRKTKDDWYKQALIHEKEHVHQIMVLGIFQPILYVLCYLVGRFVLRNTNGYYDNIFEIDARRRTGQLIDVVGAIEKSKKTVKES